MTARSDQEALAVVGVGLRLPCGVQDMDGYWKLLAEGRDAVRVMPAERKEPFADAWEGLPQRGGFLDDVLDFDSRFFGISGREARAMDPQHRLLMEVAWEALEDAALTPEGLRGSTAGVFVGLSTFDYVDWMDGDADAFWALGSGHCFAAGRLAFTLGFTGPAMAVDTACSSSLVALHLAAQSLRRGECDVALAGGVNLILSPRTTRMVHQTSSLSPDGLCRAFDARADGFTRSEGCGVVAVKRLADAYRDGDRVHAVVNGTAVNQDGRSSGLTAPNVLAQARLVESALVDAGLKPTDIGMIEAHGTGTPLGDPIEIDALASVLARSDSEPLLLGATKTNLGHLEAAAGIAGLVKAILCVQRRAVPPLVHFRTLNPRIDLTGTGFELPTRLRPWDGRHAGVSSFGMSGTNAHVIIGRPDDGAPTTQSREPAGVASAFELSAKTPAALRRLAESYRVHLAGMAEEDYPAFVYMSCFGRSRHTVRARVEAANPSAAAAALAAVADGVPSDAVVMADTQGGPRVPDLPRRVVDIPHYPWERHRYALTPRSHTTGMEEQG